VEHLSAQSLAALARGLSGPHSEIEAHLAGCALCQRTLEDLAGVAQRAAGPALERGAVLGRYVILERRGAGAMGVVYAAYDPELERKVALKLVRGEAASAGTAALSDRLRREARAMAKLAHPNVVAIHDVGVALGQVFLAMEYVEGDTLSAWLRARSRSSGEILAVFAAAGRGLAAAHAEGLVHRDVKPDNILVGDDGRVRVTDFGLVAPQGAPHLTPSPDAAFSPGAPRVTHHFGTPAYLAPEQLEGKPADARSDQFSFCASLHEALLGERAFDGDTPEALLASIRSGKRRRRPLKEQALPGGVMDAIEQGLSADPARRFPTLAPLLDALDTAPRVARQRRFLGAAAVLTLSVGAGVFALARTPQCRGAEQRLDGVWDGARAEVIHQAFLASGKPYAEDAWKNVKRALDRQARDWVGMRVEACEATQVQGVQPAAVMELRMSCLDRRLLELKAATDVLAVADGPTVDKAFQVAGSLGSLAFCANADALAAPVRPPEDPAGKARVDALIPVIARGRALKDAGKVDQALPLANRAVEEARSIGHLPTRADAEYLLGQVLMASGKAKEAEPALKDAFYDAEAGRHDALAAAIATDLVLDVGNRAYLARYPEGEEWGRHALAALSRTSGDPAVEAQLLTVLGNLYMDTERYDLSIATAQKGLAIRERLYGPDDRRTAVSHLNLGSALGLSGKHAEAKAHVEKGLAMVRKDLGPDHPNTASSIGVAAGVAYNGGRMEDALLLFGEAAAIYDRTLGPTSTKTAEAHSDYGDVLALLRRFPEAKKELLFALPIQEKELGKDHPQVGATLAALADVHSTSGRRRSP
jgi:tetratricopeptide (TPR) repeat protein